MQQNSNSSTTEQSVTEIKLARQLREALEREAATAEILKAIASSPSDVSSIFEAITERSNKLTNGLSTAVLHLDGNMLNLAGFTRRNEIADAALTKLFPRLVSDFKAYERTIRAAIPVQIEDCEVEFADEPALLDMSRKRGFRSVFLVPLLRNSVSIGLISVTRAEAGTVSDDHIRLLQTFADQAVIAIENARLFNEVQAKTRDLTEALTYQTGSSNILRVIASSPTDVGPALDAIVESAREICEAHDAVVMLKDGDELHFRAQQHGPIPINLDKWPINRESVTGRSVVDRLPVQVRDMLSDEGG